jgi:hypothetical protein
MNDLKKAIQQVLNDKTSIDWLIVHSVSKLNLSVENVEFSFVDGKEKHDEVFNTNQGFISLKTKDSINLFKKILIELEDEFKDNHVALANLYIIITRTSYKGEDKESYIKEFKLRVNSDTVKIIFENLIDSLNNEYYKQSYSKNTNINNTEEWLSLFRSAEYSHGFSDPILYVLNLVKVNQKWIIDFNYIKKMKPVLRASLIGWYGFDLIISKKTFNQILKDDNELAFISAYLIDDIGKNKTSPEWLTTELVNCFIQKHWDNIGKHMFFHTFGLSYRNKNENNKSNLFELLETLIHCELIKILHSNNGNFTKWINKVTFPSDFITLFSWFSIKEIDLATISDENEHAITNQFISELSRIYKEIPSYIATDRHSDPFDSYQLSEPKYLNTLAYILIFLLDADENNYKEIKKICYDFKPLFYGAYHSKHIANNFTELLLLIFLSAHRIVNLNEDLAKNIGNLFKILDETILIPYIHLSEQNDEIWSTDKEKYQMSYNAGKYLVNEYIIQNSKHEVNKYYQDFLEEVKNIKVTQWPFERNE